MQSHHLSQKSQFVLVVFVVLLAMGILIFGMGHAVAGADDNGIAVVSTPEEMTASVPADVSAVTTEVIDPASVSVDKLQDLGLTSEEAQDAVSADAGEGAQTIAQSVDLNGTAEATVLEDDTVLVDYPFALKRLAVRGTVDEEDVEGCSAAAYDELTGYTIMAYDSMEAAAEAYDRLTAKYGAENVFVDTKAEIAADLGSYTGWGVESGHGLPHHARGVLGCDVQSGLLQHHRQHLQDRRDASQLVCRRQRSRDLHFQHHRLWHTGQRAAAGDSGGKFERGGQFLGPLLWPDLCKQAWCQHLQPKHWTELQDGWHGYVEPVLPCLGQGVRRRDEVHHRCGRPCGHGFRQRKDAGREWQVFLPHHGEVLFVPCGEPVRTFRGGVGQAGCVGRSRRGRPA